MGIGRTQNKGEGSLNLARYAGGSGVTVTISLSQVSQVKCRSMSGSFGIRKGRQQDEMDEAPSRHFATAKIWRPRSTTYSLCNSDRHVRGIQAHQEK
jgi:hypothetical protein